MWRDSEYYLCIDYLIGSPIILLSLWYILQMNTPRCAIQEICIVHAKISLLIKSASLHGDSTTQGIKSSRIERAFLLA